MHAAPSTQHDALSLATTGRVQPITLTHTRICSHLRPGFFTRLWGFLRSYHRERGRIIEGDQDEGDTRESTMVRHVIVHG
ncbi:hypothetical protein MY10362_000104 [Beauveria mimosiformis]